MANVYSAEFGCMDAFAATHHAAGEAHTTAASADPEAMLASAASALGPIGATYLAAYAPAQCTILAGATLAGRLNHAISSATQAHKAAMIATDNA